MDGKGEVRDGGAMSDAITESEFRTAPNTQDWEVQDGVAAVEFATGDFATGLRLVNALGEVAEEANHHPDIVLTYPSVTVRLTSHDIGGLSYRDAHLAGRFSEVAAAILNPAD